MMHMEPGVVLKYFEALDVFVRVRRYTADEIAQLLSTAKITDRRSYVGLVVNACIVDLSPRHLQHEDLLYDLCVDVNPGLDIRKVTIATKEEARQIHLLEGAPAAPTQDFRRLKDMEEALSRRIIGQDAAISAVSRAVKKSMTGLRDP